MDQLNSNLQNSQLETQPVSDAEKLMRALIATMMSDSLDYSPAQALEDANDTFRNHS